MEPASRIGRAAPALIRARAHTAKMRHAPRPLRYPPRLCKLQAAFGPRSSRLPSPSVPACLSSLSLSLWVRRARECGVRVVVLFLWCVMAPQPPLPPPPEDGRTKGEPRARAPESRERRETGDGGWEIRTRTRANCTRQTTDDSPRPRETG